MMLQIPGHYQVQVPPVYGLTCLRLTEKETDERPEAMALLKPLLGRRRFHAPMDALLGSLLPQFLPEIQAFYRERGPSMNELYAPDAIAQVDALLARIYQQLVAIYDEIERQGWRQGMAMPETIRLAVTNLRIEPVVLPRLPRR